MREELGLVGSGGAVRPFPDVAAAAEADAAAPVERGRAAEGANGSTEATPATTTATATAADAPVAPHEIRRYSQLNVADFEAMVLRGKPFVVSDAVAGTAGGRWVDGTASSSSASERAGAPLYSGRREASTMGSALMVPPEPRAAPTRAARSLGRSTGASRRRECPRRRGGGAKREAVPRSRAPRDGAPPSWRPTMMTN